MRGWLLADSGVDEALGRQVPAISRVEVIEVDLAYLVIEVDQVHDFVLGLFAVLVDKRGGLVNDYDRALMLLEPARVDGGLEHVGYLALGVAACVAIG